MTLGRPRLEESKRIPISLAMNPVTVAAIDAVRKNYSRSEYFERIVNRALEDL